MMYPVILMDLPTTIRSFVKRTDGVDTIVINARLSREMQMKRFLHEMEHIENDDLDSTLTADEIERKRHEE